MGSRRALYTDWWHITAEVTETLTAAKKALVGPVVDS